MRVALPTFEERFRELFVDAYRIAFRLLGERGEAEDVAQEACARAYARWSTVRDYAAPWCVRVAGNLALDRIRARKRSGGLLADRDASSLDGVAAIHERLDLHRALEALPRRQREVVLLRYLGDLSEHETATVLGISAGSVKTHASRGLTRLREVIPRD